MKKKLIFLLIAFVAVVCAFAVKSPYMAYTLYAFLLLVGIAHFSSLAWLSGLDCEREVSASIVQQGEEVEVRLTLTNRRGWPIPWIFIEDHVPLDFPRRGENARMAVLMPGQSVSLDYALTCPRRGYHRIGPLIMESGDLFGLQKRFRTGEQQEYLSVLPTIAYIDTFNIASRRPQGTVRVSNRIYEDPTLIGGLREYVAGDPLNRIHWKASARTGELFTKTYEPSTVSGGTLLLDFHEAGYQADPSEDRKELAVTVTASIAYLLQISGEQVGMLTNASDAAEVARYTRDSVQGFSRAEVDEQVDDEAAGIRISPLVVPTLRSPIQAQQIAENLARVLPGTGLLIEDVLLDEFQRLPRNAAILAVLPRVSEKLALTLAEMKVSGFNVTVFLVRNQDEYEESAALLVNYGIYMIHIRETRDLHEIAPQKIGQ